jgi:hypothetical protein
VLNRLSCAATPPNREIRANLAMPAFPEARKTYYFAFREQSLRRIEERFAKLCHWHRGKCFELWRRQLYFEIPKVLEAWANSATDLGEHYIFRNARSDKCRRSQPARSGEEVIRRVITSAVSSLVLGIVVFLGGFILPSLNLSLLMHRSKRDKLQINASV